MQFRLSGIYGQKVLPCKIYGYVREEEKQECEAVYLGTCDLAGEIIAFSLELPEKNVSESRYSINDFNGMVFLADNVMYGTGWDENPVCLDEIRFEKNKEEREEETEKELEKNLEEETEEPELEIQENPFPPTPSILEEVGEECQEEIIETGEIEEKLEEPEELEEPEKSEKLEESEESSELEESFYCPFKDGEFEQCAKIGLLDYNQLNPCDQGLLNNNFLRYGWRRYKHALIGKDTKRNCYILGVPGTYNRQEALMAGMFGFPYFKEAKCETTEMSAQEVQGHFGYWYRSINPPDRNRGNRS